MKITSLAQISLPQLQSQKLWLVQCKDAAQRLEATRLILPENHDTLQVTDGNLEAELGSFSLFDTRPLLLTGCEKLSKTQQATILDWAKNPDRKLVLEGSDFPKAFKTSILEHCVLVELAELKAWEKIAVLKENLVKRAPLAPELAELLAKMYVNDAIALDNELEKLQLYTEGKARITLADFSAVGTRSSQATVFSLVDAILAGHKLAACQLIAELVQEEGLLALTGVLYTLFEQKLSLLELEKKPELLAKQFPQFKGAFLDKQVAAAKAFGLHRLERALGLIFDTELRAKSSQVPELTEAHMLIARLMA